MDKSISIAGVPVILVPIAREGLKGLNLDTILMFRFYKTMSIISMRIPCMVSSWLDSGMDCSNSNNFVSFIPCNDRLSQPNVSCTKKAWNIACRTSRLW